MFLDVSAKAEGLGKPNHGAFSVIEIDAGDARRRHEFLAMLADQSVDSGLTCSVTSNVLPRTKIL